MLQERIPLIRADDRRSWGIVVFFMAAGILVAASMLLRAANKDESQYVAAIALIRHGWPYLDYAYLQTPLQPLLFSPLAVLPAGWVYAGTRSANALCAFGTLLVLFGAMRSRCSGRSILVSLAALLCTQPFLLAASLARNDALPMLLMALAAAALLASIDGRSVRGFALSGLFLGLATSAKISAALPAAGAVLFLLIRLRSLGPRRLLAFFAGSLVGLLPCFVFAALAPAEFRFDVFTYSLEAPIQWWTSVGGAVDLQPIHRIARLVGLSAQGSILVALAAAAFDRKKSESRLLLDLMIVGGLVGSYMPEPAYPQYLVPLLPPLFARFPLALDVARRWWRACVSALVAIGSIAGLAFSASHISRRNALSEAAQVGPAVESLARGGRIATLSPEFVAGTGTDIDPRFAAGPFLFRTAGSLSERAQRYGRAVAWQDVQRSFEKDRPAVILAGGEKRLRRRHGLDMPLIGWALSRHYRPVVIAGRFVAYVRPE